MITETQADWAVRKLDSDYGDPREKFNALLILGAWRAQIARCRPEGECKTCDAYRGETMFPSHTPSQNCESGKQPHCTCDLCF